ncbi:MAG: translocation/assembly module TamB domain-containing protein [Bacteroidetes bacterium]|nr:translocation/assembly module TamB domain-containing protein [Bacteroidota bacterium]
MKKLFKIFGSLLLVILLLMTAAVWLLSTEKYQNLIAGKGATYLSDKLKTRVAIQYVRFEFFNHVNLEGVYVEDQQKDTLAYVGKLQLNCTDLLLSYWKGSAPVLRNIGIENAKVNLTRNKDSIWNYDFISKILQGDSKDTSTKTSPSSTTKASGPIIILHKLNLQNVRFNMDDGWRGEDIDFKVKDLVLETNVLDVKSKNILLKNLLIDEASIFVKQYDGNKPEDLSPDDSSTWGTPFNPDHFKISIDKFELNHSNFVYLKNNQVSQAGEFDEKNIVVRDINLHLKQTKVIDDTLFSHIDKLQAIERCGLMIRSATADVKLSQVQAMLSKLHLVTANSEVQNYYEMNYKTFHDFNDYINKVSMKAKLVKSRVSSLDIAYFAKQLNEYPISVFAEGEVEGLVGNLQAKNMNISTKQSSFRGDAVVKGLPDVNQTLFIVKNIQLHTSGADLNHLIPQTKNDNIAWSDLETIQYSGDYSGKVDSFNTKGSLYTSLGNAVLDLNMNFKNELTAYKGSVETMNFNIGKLLKQNRFGEMSMKGDINGSGFDLDDLNMKVNAVVSKIEAEGSTYNDVTINGLIENKKFDGIFVSKDPGLTMNFNGKLDISGDKPIFKFNSRFISIDLQKLGVTKKPMIVSGTTNLDFTGSTVDDFTGTASFKKMEIVSNGKPIFLEEVLLESYREQSVKTLKLSSSVADAELKGNFNISGLGNAIRVYLSHYMPQYISLPLKFTNEEFAYKVSIKDCDTLLKTFLPEFAGISGTYISGNLNTQKQLFSLDVNVPSFGFREFSLKDIVVVGAGDFTQFDMNAVAGNLLYNDLVVIPSFQINALMANDTASMSIITQSMNEVLGDAEMNLKGTASNSNLYVSVLPSNISIKDDNWQIHSNEDLIFGNQIKIPGLAIESGAQKINVRSDEQVDESLLVSIQELELHGLSDYLNLTEPSIYGRLGGEIRIDKFYSEPIFHANLISSNEIRFDKDTLGVLDADFTYDLTKNYFSIKNSSKLSRENQEIKFNGYVDMKDSTMALSAKVKQAEISVIGQFISDYVKDLHGKASGNVELVGSVRNPKIAGAMTIEAAALKIIYLGTTYTIPKANVKFIDNQIQIDDFPIYDERGSNYSGIVSGKINHKSFSKFYLDVHINSNNLLCMNTHEWNNDLFYGYMPAKFQADMKGYLDDITMDIQAKPLKGASFYMPISSSGNASTYDYVSFVQLGRSQDEMNVSKKSNYFKMNMNIEATPDAEVIIILDKNTREQIVARGNGNISLGLDMGNSMSMFGTYTISEGNYQFNFRGAFPRTFKIDEGSTIRWNGDPLLAKLNVTAIYKLEKPLPLYPLIAGKTDDQVEINEAKRKYETYVTLFLKDELASPEISFDISQPQNKAIGTMAYNKLMQIKNDERELVSQAGVLLLLGEFHSSDGFSNSTYERGGLTTASDIVESALSSGLTNVFSKLTGLNNVSLTLGYNKSYSTDTRQNNVDQFNFGISAPLFNDRFVIDINSNLDVDKSTSGKSNSNYYFGGDLKAQYLVTDDGRLRVNAFSSSGTNAEGNTVTKGGMGLSYKKVFNNLYELFSSKRKKMKVKNSDTTKKS